MYTIIKAFTHVRILTNFIVKMFFVFFFNRIKLEYQKNFRHSF